MKILLPPEGGAVATNTLRVYVLLMCITLGMQGVDCVKVVFVFN
jgi:hypothetical protein